VIEALDCQGDLREAEPRDIEDKQVGRPRRDAVEDFNGIYI